MRSNFMIRRLAVAISYALALIIGGACGALDVSNPTAIEDDKLNDAVGAELLRKAALARLYETNSLAALNSGLLADEFTYDLPVLYEQLGIVNLYNLLDLRQSEEYEANTTYSQPWHFVRTAANLALSKVRKYSIEARVGEVLAIRGYATLKIAENYCGGFPLHNVTDYTVTHTQPLSTEDALTLAVMDFDSALVHAGDSIRILNLARVFRGRALLGLGQYADAASAVRDVPTEFRQNTEHSAAAQPNNLGALEQNNTSVANREGGNGLDFVEAQDPRLPLTQWGLAQDNVTPMYRALLYPNRDAPMALATGVEARLIEAEAALHDAGDWLGILNDLRTRVPGLAPLVDPGADADRVDLLFRERAFWLFGTGSRLPDLRRLIRQYGRSSETVFPTGARWRGGTYSTATNIPFSAEAVKPFVPAVIGCSSR